MKQNVTFSIGNVALIDKVNEKYQLFNKLFDNLGTKAKNIKNSAKLFCYNRLGDYAQGIRTKPLKRNSRCNEVKSGEIHEQLQG